MRRWGRVTFLSAATALAGLGGTAVGAHANAYINETIYITGVATSPEQAATLDCHEANSGNSYMAVGVACIGKASDHWHLEQPAGCAVVDQSVTTSQCAFSADGGDGTVRIWAYAGAVMECVTVVWDTNTP
jgi:hypothetical protein